MKLLPSIFYAIEVGGARSLVRLIPLVITVLGIAVFYNIKVYKGLPDAPSMDNAQLARQVVRHQGFNTYFIRPYALMQENAFKAKNGQTELFPPSLYSGNTPRIIPDTYNSPGYPLLLAALYKVVPTNFDEPYTVTFTTHLFSGDRWIPPLNEIFILLTAGMIFLLGYRLFDDRVAWMASVVFLFSDFVWKFSLEALPVNFLMFLMTVLFFAVVEISRMCEERFDEDEQAFGLVWLWVPLTAILLGVICLNSLPLLILVLPFVVYVMLMRKTHWFFPVLLMGIVGVMTAPWFYHWYRVCGNPLGSNLTLGLLGQGDYTGDQVYTTPTIPSYSSLFNSAGTKEFTGFRWYLERGWDLLGSNIMVLLFAASIIHEFRRRQVQAFRWLVVGCAFAIVAMTNLANAQPEPVGTWNTVAILFPAMILIGCAFFFTLLDGMKTQLPLLTSTIVVSALGVTIFPMVLGFFNGSLSYFNYPPYHPPYISYISRLLPADEWVTTDMPWATAWYGDRPSLWLPDSVNDFDHINDDINSSGLMLISPVTTGKPMTNLTSGEQKEWLPILNGNIPETFPLRNFAKLPAGGPEYITLSSHRSAGH